MDSMYIALYLITVVAGESCPHEVYYRCSNCDTKSICIQCKVGFWNLASNCSNTCISQTCTCTSYKECLSCKDGHYGIENNCNRKCSNGCNGETCNSDGTCLCKHDFTGNTCDSCVDGKYGANCSVQCSLGCDGNVCESRNGTCKCRKNYSGELCEYCVAGHYGKDCSKTCSLGCFPRTCSFTDGHCDCDEYYTGDKCDSCVDGKYGAQCILQCSRGCESNTCTLKDGSCNCSINFTGRKCDKCINGRHGEDCSKTCSLGCLENRCSAIDGKCACRDFYTGDKCDVCVDGEYGGHCLDTMEQTHVNQTNKFSAGALTGGVISAVVVLVAAVALIVFVRRRLALVEAHSHYTDQNTTNPGGEAAQTGPYEALNTTRTEESDNTYTRLFLTGQAEMTERVNTDSSAMIMLNVIGGNLPKSNLYETLNATRLKEDDSNDNYRTLPATEQIGYTDCGNSENISINNPTISSDPHSYANMMLKK
ncbi:multiple epidermal growth factor-like domains protein 10 [Mya arenaria]|uniref:multiple epidermal growth factor-like domains protein 10 n=1 Tax=Mya arenaria TaxID=6604 RepID=UPI0022E630BB|nr:multiple epidermal growth factor-like domains protein 10 [Mya arenaria]